MVGWSIHSLFVLKTFPTLDQPFYLCPPDKSSVACKDSTLLLD